jgi:hypothetical protein
MSGFDDGISLFDNQKAGVYHRFQEQNAQGHFKVDMVIARIRAG